MICGLSHRMETLYSMHLYNYTNRDDLDGSELLIENQNLDSDSPSHTPFILLRISLRERFGLQN